ncbi:hypothetical protein B0J17DRAFT_721895 [Rhizoctonia solani]|nr:hypothetical protein B0J17DRAFT_721895 [Rhizoctonia solani]
MTLPPTVQSGLSDLETPFSQFQEKIARLRSDEQDQERDQLRHDEFLPIFKDACTLIREAELSDPPYLAELTKLTVGILNEQICYALGAGDDDYSEGEQGLFGLMPSWAHDDIGERPMIKDNKERELPFQKFIEIFRPVFAEGVTGVSQSDPQLFLTACGDGYARLFDLRYPLPVVTIDACGLMEGCEADVLVMPDSIPMQADQTLGRSCTSCVYELSTGNNMVESLAWDAHNNCLYAATQCRYIDRLGNHHDYPYAKIPKGQRSNRVDEEKDDDDDEEDDEDAVTDGERCWPKDA